MRRCLIIFVGFLMIHSFIFGASPYEIIDIFGMEGVTSTGNSINNHGDVTGFWGQGDSYGAYAYIAGVHTVIDGTTHGKGINDQGQVVGTAYEIGRSYAFLYENGLLTDLGTETLTATDINNKGQIVCQSIETDGNSTSLLYDGGTFTDIGTLGGVSSCPIAINENGQIVGASTIPGGGPYLTHAFFYDGDTMIDLGTLGGDWAAANDINDLGQIVGYSETGEAGTGTQTVFLYENGQMINLGIPGFGEGINNNGQIIGNYNGGYLDGFLYENGTMYDLMDLIVTDQPWERIYVYDINDSGAITGRGLINGEYHAILLNPIPEPASLGLLTLGGLALLRKERKRIIS